MAIPSERPPRPSKEPRADVPWSLERSAAQYQINGWGAPYFTINERAHVSVSPTGQAHPAIDLFELTESLRARGLEPPLLIRFADVVGHRIQQINQAFAQAIAEYGYEGRYRGVYPVKVNQERHLVDEVVEFGRPWDFGLEAGSKPELLIALSAMSTPGGLIICNGYKDEQYIETALLAQRLDKTVIVVLERLEEVDVVVRAYQKLGIRPQLGVRAKLTARGVGRWKESGGERAKFGLSASETCELVDRLTTHGLNDCLLLLHYHIGSQISSIIPIKNALQEASHIYVELKRLGCQMGYLDVGGGLAIDYDGSKTDFHASTNYGLSEYAADVVAHIQSVCKHADVPVPTIVSESGRAIAAHHSVLVVEVVGASTVRLGDPVEPRPDAHRLLQELFETYQGILPKNVQESWHDANQAKEEAQNLFKYGYLSLRERAQAERLFWCCCEKIQATVDRLKFVPEELLGLEQTMSATYYCNFSVFQSAPDVWAIDQLFPIMPIHRLDEEPRVRATLADVTCDSDGVIDRFIDLEDERRTVDVHTYVESEPYYLGMFLNGAYQEILGDLHNLFGDTNAVHIRATEDSYQIKHVVKGDSIADVLRYVEYDPLAMSESVRKQAERALAEGKLDNAQVRTLLRHYEQALRSYTYLTSDD